MSFGQFILVLKARKWLITLIIASIFGLVMAISFILPPKYTATASVVLDVKSPDPIAGMVLPALMTPGYLATQLDLMQSERVMLGVIKQLHMTDSSTLQGQWRDETDGNGSIDSWLVDQLQRYLEIKPSRESSVINISYTAQDPAFAAGMANAIAQNYIRTTLELRTEPAKQYRALFGDQAKFARDRLEAAQARLSAFQNEKGMIATDERIDIENTRLNELSTQLVMQQALSAETRGRQATASGNTDRLQEVLNNPVIANLQTDLSRNEARLKELSARYGDAHPLVAELKASIAESHARIEQEIKKVAGSLGVNNSVSQVRELQIKAELEQQRQKVMKLRAQHDEANVMVHDVETAQRDYDAISARLSQSALESQSNQTNVSLVKVATPPYKPSSPKTVLNGLLAFVVGTMLAIVTALMLEIRDRRLRTEEDVEDGLGVPLLGCLPEGLAQQQMGGVRRLLPFMGTKDVPKLTGPSV